jgi:hypothetical protein
MVECSIAMCLLWCLHGCCPALCSVVSFAQGAVPFEVVPGTELVYEQIALEMRGKRNGTMMDIRLCMRCDLQRLDLC